jgi:hypothetical protein
MSVGLIYFGRCGCATPPVDDPGQNDGGGDFRGDWFCRVSFQWRKGAAFFPGGEQFDNYCEAPIISIHDRIKNTLVRDYNLQPALYPDGTPAKRPGELMAFQGVSIRFEGQQTGRLEFEAIFTPEIGPGMLNVFDSGPNRLHSMPEPVVRAFPFGNRSISKSVRTESGNNVGPVGCNWGWTADEMFFYDAFRMYVATSDVRWTLRVTHFPPGQ